ncbi:MAG: pyridoxamine kinase [Clostridia bacterium]|nr:pyridoxamine kinase [Clostridia bacterium]
MNHTPKVAAIHDLSGLGRCSLTVVLPVLSAMGIQCCPLPTAVLSAHTAFPASEHASFRDLTGEVARSAEHWKELGVAFDAIYSGFLGSAQQIGVLRSFITSFRKENTVVLVDPVMGDNGRPYRTYTPEMCSLMKDLSAEADIITPNLTEAALLLGEDFRAIPATQAGTGEWLKRLSMDGRRSVVLTGVSFTPGMVGAGCYECRGGRVRFAMAQQEPAQFSGTGDLFASVTLGALLRGAALDDATARAVDFVRQCVHRTLAVGAPLLDGVQFEPLLRELM